jgi:hypothetical protein
MDNELTQPLGELSPLYSLGTEFTKQRGGTGHVVTDEDTNALRLATQIMQGQDQDLAQNRITAYHGSPYDFEQFDTSKIGTGEGAQAYGHGLYFAEHEPVAMGYRDALVQTKNPIQSTKKLLSKMFENEPESRTIENIKWHMKQDPMLAPHVDDDFVVKNISAALNNQNSDGSVTNAALDAYRKLSNKFEDNKKGHMYEVNIAAQPEHFLDWDKPLSEQSQHVQNAIKATRKNLPPNAHADLGGDYSLLYGPDITPGQFLNTMESIGGRPDSGEKLLQSSGVRGIRYLDAGSRGNKSWVLTHPQGNVNEFPDENSALAFHAKNPEYSIKAPEVSRNYVVFDPKDIEIMRRYARGGDVRHGYSLDGMVKPDNNTIEMPHSLKELQDWSKTHPAPKPMVRASDDPTSILYNERKLDMPNSLEELQNWARTHHASGGSIDHIAKAMHLARKHFEDGGESGESKDSEWTHDYNSSLGASDNADNSGSKSDNPRADSLAQSQQASDDAQRAADIRANNQDVGRFSFGQGLDVSGGNYTGHDAPTGLVDYTEQRLNTPYEGTLLSSAMDPSTAYGMSYPELVGRQLSKTGAQAFLANLGYESTQGGKVFNPQAVSGSGYGLAQWTDPKRQQEFFSAMMQPGQAMPQTAQEKRDLLATTTPQQQLGYALKEALSGKYGPSAQAMTTPGNLADKVATIARNYEGAGIPAIGNRVALANQIAADKGYGTFAQNTFSDAPSSVYAANVPTPIARPENLNPAQAAAVAQNIPTPTARPSDLGQTVASTPSADPYGTAKIAEMARAILSAQRPNAPTPSVSATRNTLPFIGSTEDPELIARQQAMLLAMRGYASGGKVNDDISHALRIAASMGRGNDSILAHINPHEAALLKKHGGSGKINPHTGLMEFDDNEGGNENNDNAQADAKDPDASYHDMMNQPGWGSEDPGLIAGFNANNAEMGYGNTGPQSTRGEIAVGQTVPDTMVPGVDAKGNYAMQPSLGSKISDFLGGIFNPSFVGVNSPGYAKMAEQKDAPPSANNPGNKGGDNIIPPIRPIPQAGTVAAADVLPTTPSIAQTPYIPPTPQPYASLGANFINPSVYQNPYLTRFLATGGKVHGNNATGNAIRMAMGYKP